MKQETIKDELLPHCPIRHILARICDKWSLLVLYTLETKGVVRFGDLQRAIPDISQKMLTATLRHLEADGYVSRKVYAVVPPKVEYALTERGVSLLPNIDALIVWAKNNMNAILADRGKALLS